VQAALRARQGRQALRLLEQHGAMLQSGPLAEEAQAARIAAYCQMGRAAEARAAIDKLPASWPRSPLTAAILRECDALRAAGPAN
jgi:outer membrane protein assembly factor BamD (BamD/ComL family)